MRKLLQRRVPQLVGLYVAGSWGFVQFVDWAQQEYALSPALTNFVIALLLLLLPSVFVLAWRHGTPGPNRWGRVDAAVLSVNGVAAAIVLAAVFGGRSLGATTTTIKVEDPEGREVERVVARDAFRRKVFLPFFDNATGDSTLDWLQLGLPSALHIDLVQDLFVEGVSPFGDAARGIQLELTRAGYPDGVDLPLALKLKLAEERHLDHLLSGRLVPADSGLEVEVELYDVPHERRTARRTVSGADAFSLVDSLTVALKHDLGVPSVQLEESPDLPISELLTPSLDAFRDFVLAEWAGIRGDYATRLRLLHRAVDRDSTFAAAEATLAVAELESGRGDGRAAMREAKKHLYRLPESRQLAFRTLDAFLYERDVDRAIATARYWAELYPDDVLAHRFLAEFYGNRGDWKESAGQLRAVLEIDPAEFSALLGLARLETRAGAFDRALGDYERYAELFPDDASVFVEIGDLRMLMGRQAEAREAYARAGLIAPDDPTTKLALAWHDVHMGDFEAAAARVADALAAARTASDSALAFRVEEWIGYRTGRWAAMAAAERGLARELRAANTPPAAASELVHAWPMRWAGEWGRSRPVLRRVDSLEATFRPPTSEVLSIQLASLRAELGDTAGARREAEVAEAAIATFGIDTARAELEVARGLLAERAGDCAAAVGHYRTATRLSAVYQLPRLYLGRCLRRTGQAREAQEVLRSVIRVSPSNAHARVELARACVDLGRRGEATAQLDTALAIWKDADPDYAPAREARALRASL